jgi:hypothetical protein
MPKDTDHMSTEWHIGKRSAAGMYCWDCKKTLCLDGESFIHHSKNIMGEEPKWSKTCPFCGRSELCEELSESSVGRELGFAKEKPKAKKGVASCCSFSWAKMPFSFWQDLKAFSVKYPKKAFVVDEYGHEYTASQFVDVLQECPVQFTHFVGREFC